MPSRPQQAVAQVVQQVCTPPSNMQHHMPCLDCTLTLWSTYCACLQASGPEVLSETSAKQLLLQWQQVKADALGNHIKQTCINLFEALLLLAPAGLVPHSNKASILAPLGTSLQMSLLAGWLSISKL